MTQFSRMTPSLSVSHAADREILSVSGSLNQVWVPAELGVAPAEIGQALIAWRYDLSKAEVKTLDLIAQGLTNDDLARALGLQEVKSVKNRVQAILDKMAVRNRTRAAVIAARYGLGALPGTTNRSAEIPPSVPRFPEPATLRKPPASVKLRDVKIAEPNTHRAGG
jgi:DNA-binding CsgD family transcriptional regulator